MWYIFEKRIVQRYQKWYSHLSNAQTQIHKYTNIQIHKYSIWQSARKAQHVVYFERRIVQGYQKWYSNLSNAQIHKYKYTNTQIQHMMKYQKDPICGIFLKRGLFKGIKNDTPMCQTCKYTNTNTQIQHMTKCQKDPTCSIFLKKGLFKGIKNYIPMCQMRKCKVKCQKDPTCGIFWKGDFSRMSSESRTVVQGLVLRCIWIYIECVHINTTHKCHKYLEVTVSFIMPFNALGLSKQWTIENNYSSCGDFIEIFPTHKYHMCIKFTCTSKLVSSVNFIMYIVIYMAL